MDTTLDSLDPRFKPLAMELLARCVEARIAVRIINTRRTAEEQAANLAKGVSWVKRSKHQDGLAIDIAPYAQFALHGENKIAWDGRELVWQSIGAIGEKLGLRWGGRWSTPDLGHFEYVNKKPKTEEV